MAEPKPIRKRRPGAALKITGTVLIVAVLPILFFTATSNFLWKHDWLIMPYLTTLALMGPISGLLLWRGRKLAARASAQDIITESGRHVLYLRAFESDSSAWGSAFRAFGPVSMFMAAFSKTEEEQLAEVLRPFGDLIAIGKPGEGLPTPGAARIYTSDDEWQEVVKRRIKEAQFVVIRAAPVPGENVFWELRQVIEILNPQKLLILFRNMDNEDYESFRTRANSVLPIPLPEAKQVRRWYWRVSGFFSFDADWKPDFFTLTGPYFRSNSFRSRCIFALKPIFEGRGLEWERPRISVRRALMVGIFLLFGVAGSVMSFLEEPTFPSQQHKEAFAQRTATECMSERARRMGIRDPSTLKMQFGNGCDCLARGVTNVINLQEVKALESGQVPSSYLERKENAAAQCGVWVGGYRK
jgi:hypothetical protein